MTDLHFWFTFVLFLAGATGIVVWAIFPPRTVWARCLHTVCIIAWAIAVSHML